MQAHLFREHRPLSSIFCAQPAPTVAAQQASEERYNDIQQDIKDEIKDKQERIVELRKEIGDAVEHIVIVEEEELELEPDDGCEDVVFAEGPQLEADLQYLRYENEEAIRTLEEEIAEERAKVK